MLDLRAAAIFQDFAEQAVRGIQANIREKRITKFGAANASGQAAESLRYRLTENGFDIYVEGKAVSYFDTLEHGRKPGKMPPINQIREWIDIKGLVIRSVPGGGKISKDSMAFLIARKIAKEGTQVYKQGGNTGILTDILNPDQINQIKLKIIPLFVADATRIITNLAA